VHTEIRLKRAFDRALKFGISASFVFFAVGGLQAAGVLWSNGAVTQSSLSGSNRCDSGPNICTTGPTGPGWTIFDNFSIPSSSKAWSVSGFDFTDFLVNGTTSDVKSTSWSIWNGDPLSGGKLYASGTATPSAMNVSGTCGNASTCLETFTVNFGATGALYLAAGNTYYLGTSNVVTVTNNNEATLRAFSAGGNTAPGGTGNSVQRWEQSNGSTSGVIGSPWVLGSENDIFPGTFGITETSTAFDINGTLVPEPGTLTLLVITFAGICFLRRRRLA
jgi:hypothetical protein